MAQAYTAPDWSNGEGISVSNLQSISNTLEGIIQGSDRAIHKVEINGSNLIVTYVDGTQETFSTVGMKGIVEVTKSSSGKVDTYTIHFTDGTTYSFDVTNGGGGGSDINVIDNLVSTSSEDALSANMGHTLNANMGGLKFGYDADGNYGYYKVGADTLTPFKSGGFNYDVTAQGTATPKNGTVVKINCGFKPKMFYFGLNYNNEANRPMIIFCDLTETPKQIRMYRSSASASWQIDIDPSNYIIEALNDGVNITSLTSAGAYKITWFAVG